MRMALPESVGRRRMLLPHVGERQGVDEPVYVTRNRGYTMRVCSQYGCPTIYPASEGGRCLDHRQQARAARVDNAVYSSKGHRSFRSAVLQRDPICVLCGVKFSTVADHYPMTRRELIDAGLNPNDPQYGRGLDADCHNAHTAATSPGGWAATN